jgi:hypothetical protein
MGMEALIVFGLRVVRQARKLRQIPHLQVGVLRIRDCHVQEITTFERRLVELFGLPAVPN